MPLNLVTRAIEQSATREMIVRAMALLSSARVLVTADKNAAKQAYSEGVVIAQHVPLDARHRGLLLEQAVRLGATADPVSATILFRQLPSDEYGFRHSSTGTMLVQSFAERGEFDAALQLLEGLRCEAGGAPAVIHFAADLRVQRRALIAARARW